MRTKREKTYGMRARTLTGADRGRIMQNAHDYNALNRKPGQHNGPLTHAYLVVLRTLLFRFHHQVTGECFPSYAAIAKRSGVSRTTVGEAVKALELADILTWSHRIGRTWRRVRDVLTGQLVRLTQVVRLSNAYEFRVPSAPAKSAFEQDTRRKTDLSAGLESSKSGNRPGHNINTSYKSNQASSGSSVGMSDCLKAALDSLERRIQA